MNIYGYAALMAILTFGLTVVVLKKLIPLLKSKKMGQKILEIGPRWHMSKDGTPTMGGLSFLCVVTLVGGILLLVSYLTGDAEPQIALGGALTMLLALANGCVGIFDDWKKLQKKQNEGLTAPQKFMLQLICAALYLAAMRLCGLVDTVLRTPFTSVAVDLGFFYYVLMLFLITGVVNSVNLTDGIDGLLSMITLPIGGFLMLCAIKMQNVPLAIIAAGVLGAALGFLVYNYHPARVFMGDTGSLFFGGLFAGTAFMIGVPFLMFVYGIVFICESASVILQVGSYKLTRKRIFKMAPIHHHFEMCGWSELKICYVFAGITLLFCILSYFAI